MKTIIVSLIIFFFISTVVLADIYVKGTLHFEGGYRYGISAPEADMIYEWWFGRNKVTFQSVGWHFRVDAVMLNNDWCFTLDKEKQRIIASNLDEKFFIEVPLSMNLLSHVDTLLVQSLKNFGMS